ncbi:MFS transporter [Fructilactobacillus frigidiflavus]|uniref:MFS transporter n=1 Tax=Fructilactobacillus frigidiflavus TaxID=3242688 RepID=UPI003756D0AE
MKKAIKNQKNWWAIGVILIAVFSLLAIQARSGDVIVGYDTFFHFNRIYETAMQFQTGRFSYFMANFGYCQSGQIVNAVYGPYMAYLLGLLLFLTHSWVNFQLVSAFILLFSAGIGAYLLFRRLKINYYLATAGAILFLSQNFITYWLTSTAFLDWGSMMLPFAVLVGLDLLSGSAKQIHVSLALVVAILIEMHILSAVITVLLLILFFLVGVYRSQAKGAYLQKIGLNVGLTLLLTANYFAAFFDVFGHNHLIAPFRVQSLQSGGMQLVDQTLMQGGVGFVFIIIITAQIIFILFNLNRSNPNVMLTTIGLFFFGLSSEYFPWDQIGKHVPIFRDFLQFPSRFYAVAALLLLTGFLLSINQFMQQVRFPVVKNIYLAGVGLLALTAVLIGMGNVQHQLTNNWQAHNLAPQAGVYAQHLLPYGYYPKQVSNEGIRRDFQGPDLGAPLRDSIRANTDYLPNHTHFRQPRDLQSQYKKQITYNESQFVKHPQHGGKVLIQWDSPQSRLTMIPLVAYHDTQLNLNGQPLKNYQLSQIGGIYVPAQAGKNRLLVSYQAPMYVKLAIFVSLMSWLGLAVYLIYQGFKRLINGKTRPKIMLK